MSKSEEKYTVRPITEVLDESGRRDLALMCNEPGWAVLKDLADMVQTGWQSQAMLKDYKNIESDSIIVRHMIHGQGMVAGLGKFLRYIDKWNEIEKAKKRKAKT